jgi:AcrR family transcriptional regulator
MEHTPGHASPGSEGDSGWDGTLSAHRTRQADRIAAVAMDIITAQGFGALSMSSLAEAAGVSRQTLYKYFADIDAVLEALAMIGSAGIVELAERTAAAPRPANGIRIFVEAVVAAAAAGHPSASALMAAVPPAAREGIRAHDREAEGLVIELLRRGRGDGSFRSDIDPILDGRIIYRAVLAVHDLAAEPGIDLSELSERVASDMLRIVQADGRRRAGRRC